MTLLFASIQTRVIICYKLDRDAFGILGEHSAPVDPIENLHTKGQALLSIPVQGGVVFLYGQAERQMM